MKKIIFSLIFLILCTNASADKIFSIELSNIDNTITFTSINLVDGEYKETSLESNYKAEIKDNSDKVIYSTFFTPPFYGPFTITLPYEKNIKKIVLKNIDNEILSIPAEQFAESCGNNACDPQESYESCPQDCSSGSNDDYCDSVSDGICDPDCNNETDVDCRTESIEEKPKETEKEETKTVGIEQPSKVKKSKKRLSYVTLLIIIIVAGIVLSSGIVVFLTKVKAKNARITQLRDYFIYYLNQGYTQQQLMETLLKNGYNQKEIMSAYNLINKR